MLELDGQRLSLAQVVAVARGQETVVLARSSHERVTQSRKVVAAIIAEGRTVYGVNTGFGKLSDVRIELSQLRELQLNLVRSHSCGLGAPLSIEEARAMLLMRANVLATGYSGARSSLIDALIAMLEHGVVPVIPEKGSVGASGDLAPLSHLALALIGEGSVRRSGHTVPAARAFRDAKLRPATLAAKEGLALVNGVQMSVAVGGLALSRAIRLARVADLAGAMTLEGLMG